MKQVDPSYNFKNKKQLILSLVGDLIDSEVYILGSKVEEFESAWASYCKSEYAVGCASGTDAIELILRAIDGPPSSFVLTPSHTAVATVAAIIRAGYIPFFVDVDLSSYTISVKSLRTSLNLLTTQGKSISALIAVHLYGHPCDLAPIIDMCKQYLVPVVEDCSQAHGALYNNKPVGSFGLAGAFSLYPTKNLGALGDAGVITTSSKELDYKLRLIRQYGWLHKGISQIYGINSRLDPLQASILLLQLESLDLDNTHRNNIANIYSDRLSVYSGFFLPLTHPNCFHVYHQYVISLHMDKYLDQRSMASRLADLSIPSSVHYPLPVHKMPAFKNVTTNCSEYGLLNTELLIGQIISLPMGPHLTLDDANAVCEAILSLV